MLNIKLVVGESYPLQLDQLGNAGYSWEYSVEEGARVIGIELQTLSAPRIKHTISSMPNTFEAKIVFAIKAINPGVARVLFFLHRIWEKDKPSLKEILASIEVTESE